jgi:hypothetical protein
VVIPILVAQVLLGILALVVGMKYREDRPFALMTCYIVGSDLIRWVFLLAILPDYPVVAFPLVDLIWLSHFGSHVWLAIVMGDGRGSRLFFALSAVHGGVAAAVSVDYALSRRYLGWYATRVLWLRVSALLMANIAYLMLARLVVRGKRCAGSGLGLASSVVCVFQIVQYSEEGLFRLYQASLLCYIAVALVVLGGKLWKEARNNGRW